jgi:predicted component of type VI protein secretion system
MGDPKKPIEGQSLPLQGPHWQKPVAAFGTRPFTPLRLVLFPNGCTIELNRPDMVIGRHSEVDVRLHLPDVSRRHCRFVFEEGEWHILDLQSMNGVFVNDERVEQAVVHHHDLIRIGSYIFEADLEAESASVPLPASGLKTLENIADALPPAQQPKRRAS